jgi:hypothetical protein
LIGRRAAKPQISIYPATKRSASGIAETLSSMIDALKRGLKL